MSALDSDQRAVIRAHAKDTVCYVLAETGECLDLARGRVDAMTGRTLRHITHAQLPTTLPRSWMLAAVLCPGDSTEPWAAWASRLEPAQRERIIFYEPPGIERIAPQVFAGWIARHLPDPVRQEVRDFKEFNRLLGSDLNLRILLDYE